MRDSSKRIHDDANPQQEPLPTGPKAATKQRPALALLREALTELHITGTCRSVAYELMTYWSPGGTVFPAVQTLADDMGLKRRVIQYQIKTLERVGLWKRKRRTGKTNLYELHLPGDAQARFVKLSPVHVGAPPPCTWVHPKYPSEVPRAPTGRSAARPKNEGVRSTSKASSAPPHEAVASTPTQVREKSKRPNPPPFKLPDLSIWNATDEEARPHIEAMRETARKARKGWPPDVILASTDVKASAHLAAMRDIATKHKTSPVSAPEGEAPSFQLDPDLEARFAEQDRLLHVSKDEPLRPPPRPLAVGCPHCGHERMMGGSCNECGYDDGTGFSPNPDLDGGL